MMAKKLIVIAALAVSVGAAIFFWRGQLLRRPPAARPGFVQTQGDHFVIDGRPFRFVGANVAVIYGDEERALMPETMRQAAQAGVSVVRIWALGESGKDDGPTTGIARNGWLQVNPFRRGPEEWNEAAFVSLDRAIA